MSGIIEEVFEDIEEFAHDVVGGAEAIIKPIPGGKIATARLVRDEYSMKDQPVAHQDALVKNKPIAVDPLVPAQGNAITVTLNSANPALPVLPADTTRRSAVILAVDNDVYLSVDQGTAMNAANSAGANAQGVFYLTKGIPVPWDNTSQLWAAITTTGTSRVSVMSSFKGA